jgi:hypothetical protein
MNFLFDMDGGWRPAGYSETDHRRVRDACAEISRRTNYRAWFNAGTKEIGFGFYRNGEPVECLSIPMFRDDSRSPVRFEIDEAWDVDQVVHALQSGKRSMKDKMRVVNARRVEHMKDVVAKRKATARAMGDAAQERFESLGKKTVAVSGLKGN